MHVAFIMLRAAERSRELIAEAQRARLARIASAKVGVRRRIASAFKAAASLLHELGSAIERPQAV